MPRLDIAIPSQIPIRISTHLSLAKRRIETLRFCVRKILRRGEETPHLDNVPTDVWQAGVPDGTLPLAGFLPINNSRRLPAGKYMLECWEDDGSGKFIPGKLYGCAACTIPAEGCADTVRIELTEVSPSFMRIDLAVALDVQRRHSTEIAAMLPAIAAARVERGLAHRNFFGSDPSSSSYETYKTEYKEAQAAYEEAVAPLETLFKDEPPLTDRCVHEYQWAALCCPDSCCTEIPDDNKVRIWVALMLINGRKHPNGLYYQPLFEIGAVDLANHGVITEADMLASGELDFGWSTLRDTVGDWGVITSAAFGIIVEKKPVSYPNENNALFVMVENRYEGGTRRTPVTYLEATATAGRPTFKWRHDNTIGKAYPAFRLRVWTKTGNTLVYDSGDLRAPARDANGVYSWTAPIYVGAMTPEGVVFAADTDYIWSVSMLDAKFTRVMLPLVEGSGELRVSDSSGCFAFFPGHTPAVIAKSRIPTFVTNSDVTSSMRLHFTARHLLPANPGMGDTEIGISPGLSSALTSWSCEIAALPFNCLLDTTGRHLPAGKYMLECWEDDGSGKFIPGKLYGCAACTIPPDGVADAVHIDLTEVSPSIMRIDLAAAMEVQRSHSTEIAAMLPAIAAAHEAMVAINDTTSQAYIDAEATYKESKAGLEAIFEEASAFADRGVRGCSWAALCCPDSCCTEIPDDNKVRIWVAQMLINGRRNSSGLYYKPLFEIGAVDLENHGVITEADMLSSGELDLGWSTLRDSMSSNWSAITNAAFGIIVEKKPVSYPNENNVLLAMVENRYESGSAQSPVTYLEATATAGRPTFKWRHYNTIGKAYPAFRLRVWTKTGNKLVYDSGDLRAPARDANGVYSWTAPIYVGAMTPEGVVFAADTDYVWGVSMLDAKFPVAMPKAIFEGRGELRVSDS